MDFFKNLQFENVSISEYNKIVRENTKLKAENEKLLKQEIEATITIEKLDKIIYNLRNEKMKK